MAVGDQSTIHCPQCGRENPPDAQFCMRCGAALSKQCPACGATNSLSAQFCLRCGVPLAGTTITERRVLTVLFADLVGSTQLVQRIDPEPMRALTDEYFSSMRREIERYGGVVEKFIGDAVMAVFGLPTAHEDDADRAVRAAAAMQRRMTDLNARKRVDLHMRIGISTGEVIADPAAVAARQFMVTGETVNLASRLQTHAPTDGIVVDERTYRALRVQGEYAPMPAEGEFAARPRWQVLAITEGQPAKRLRAPLIGRQDEMQFLLALYRRVADGHKQHLVTVFGAAGAGKSRLIEEFARTLQSEEVPPHLLRGRCPSYGEGLTYWPLAEMVKQECNVKDNDAPAVVIEKLRAGVRRVCEPMLGPEESAKIAADLAALLGLSMARPSEVLWRERLQALKQVVEGRTVTLKNPSIDEPRGDGDVLMQSLRAFFVAKARRSPLILIFEDLHWAEESLLNLLERVGVRGPDVPILTLCLARPELLERRPDWGARLPSHTTLSLSPLPADLSRVLMTELLNGEIIRADVRDAILAKAEGNPFFIEEILRRLIDGGELVRDERGWRWAAPSLEIIIPDTIHGILTSRLDLLTPLEKRVIQDASVAGRIFWLNAVAALAEMDAAEAAVALDRLQERDLIEARTTSSLEGEREFAFTHALIREVAYSILPKISRSARHLRFAQWLEQASGERVDKFLEVLAHHYEQAWRHKFDTGEIAEPLARKAIEALRRAGARATSLRTLPEARRLYERALTILRNAGLTGDVHLYLELLTEHAEVVKWMVVPAVIDEDTDTVLQLAPKVGREDLVARAWLNRAFAEYDRNHLQAADDVLRRALQLFRTLNDRQGEAEVLEMLGGVTSDLRGSLLKAQEAYREVLALYRSMGDGQGMARTMAWLGRAVLSAGNLKDADRLLNEALQLARKHHERISEASAVMGLAILAHLRGSAPESVALHRETIALCQALGDLMSEASARRHLAMHYLRRGKPEEAERELRTAQTLRGKHGAKSDSAQILRALAEVYLAKGELLIAADHAEQALALATAQHDHIAGATHAATFGKIRAAQGRAEEAESLFQQSLPVLESREYGIDLALTLMKYGESLLMLKQPGRAQEALQRARALFAEMEATNFVKEIDARLETVKA